MQRVWIPRTGGPEVLEVKDEPDPQPRAGEVRIRVAAAGVNFADIMARMGLYPDAPRLPTVVGYEVSGEVDSIGQGVADFEVGARVLALTRFGGYASAVCVPATQVTRVPEGVTLEAAAATPVTYLTAWLMLVRLGNVQPGETVLVHGVGGGVGQAALQLCRWRGASVIGTASAGKHEALRAQGVAHLIDYRSQDVAAEVERITAGRGVDVALDPVGGRSFAKSYASLAPMGRLFLFGASSLAPGKKRSVVAALRGLLAMPSFKPLPLMDQNRGVFGVNMGHLWSEQDRLTSMLEQIVALIASGDLAPVVDRSFPFAEAAAAHAYLQDHKNLGKVLLTP